MKTENEVRDLLAGKREELRNAKTESGKDILYGYVEALLTILGDTEKSDNFAPAPDDYDPTQAPRAGEERDDYP